MARKGLLAQHIANAYPLWSDMRADEQSLARQLLNPVANTMDDMYKQLLIGGDNYFLTTARVSDIDVYHFARLPQDFEFQKQDGDTTEWFFTPPPVSGLLADGTMVNIQLAEKNDVESFWYTAVPDRISLYTTASGQQLLASGIMQTSPLTIVIPSGIVDPPDRLSVTMSGGFAYVFNSDDNHVYETTVQIEGITRPGAHITEEMRFVHDATLSTLNEYQQVYDVRCYGTPHNQEAEIFVEIGEYNHIDHFAAFQLLRNKYNENVLVHWGVGPSEETGEQVLQARKYDTDEVLNRLAGYTRRQAFTSFQLQDTSGNPIVPIDLGVEPHSERLWVVTSGTLYLYDAYLHYPDMSRMEKRTYDAPAVIQPSVTDALPGETVQFFYVFRRPVSEIQRYRIWVIKPDGTRKSIVAGEEITYVSGASSWQPGPVTVTRNIQSPDEFTLTEVGDHTYCLEAYYVNGQRSLDQKVVSVQAKRALAEFAIGQVIGDYHPITGIDIDSEYKIWIKNAGDVRYQIDLHYDNMLIDWKRKVIYFHEPYEQVRIFDYID